MTSQYTGKMVLTQRFGRKATISRFPDAIVGPGQANPVHVAQIFDEIWQRSLHTLQDWAGTDAQRPDQPTRLIFSYFTVRMDDKALYIDMHCERVRADVALEWYASRFNLAGARDNLARAIQRAANNWASKNCDPILIARETGVEETDRMP